MPIAIKDPTSWSPAITGALEEALPMLRNYQERRAQTAAEREANPGNIRWYTEPPRNPYRGEREDLAGYIDAEIAKMSIMAWHCTRLCADEIEAVKRAGMFLLSPDTFAARVQRRLDARDITSTVADRLRAENLAASEHRTNQLHFVLTKGQGGLRELLGFWGGEALYRGNKDDLETGQALKALGTSCVIELADPRAYIHTRADIGMNILRTFELMHGLKDENTPDCEGHIRQPIPPDQVLRIIMPDDADFAAITAERD